MCFVSSPKPPPVIVQEPPKPPSLDDPEVRTAANTIRRRGSRSKGFQYTMLTSPQGDTSDPNLGFTTLGGA